MRVLIIDHGHLCTPQLKRIFLHRPSDRLRCPPSRRPWIAPRWPSRTSISSNRTRRSPRSPRPHPRKGLTPSDVDESMRRVRRCTGSPVGATGARILATPSREMIRRGARYGLETRCIGGGQGLAALFDLV
ncbi:hypothetical protein [Pseudonocardia oceani]